jgi:hypothetical protein
MSSFKTNNHNSNKINAEQIKVCIRVRPILAPYEDEEIWGVDSKEQKISSLNSNLPNAMDPVNFALN